MEINISDFFSLFFSIRFFIFCCIQFSGGTVESPTETSCVQYDLSLHPVLYFMVEHYMSLWCSVIPKSLVKTCLCDILFSQHGITAKIIHSLDMSPTQTKLYLQLNHISDGAALLENCMLCL